MPNANVSFFWAFAAGFVSFLGPCVLPLIPGYLSFVSGLSLDEIKTGGSESRQRVLVGSMMFVAGFSVIFVLMGASASAIGGLLLTYKATLLKIAAVMIIFFGLAVMGLFNLPMFEGRGLNPGLRKKRGPFAVFLLGMAFALAWTPCIGPILTAILAYAGSTGTVRTGMALLAVYALGLGVPFILAGLLFNRFLTAFDWLRRHYKLINAVSGALLIAMGILLLTNQIVYVNSWLRHLQLNSGWSWTNL